MGSNQLQLDLMFLSQIFKLGSKNFPKFANNDLRIYNKRPVEYNEIEEALLNYFNYMRRLGRPVDCTLLQSKAQNLVENNQITITKGWIKQFLARNKVVKRKKTRQISKLRNDYQEEV